MRRPISRRRSRRAVRDHRVEPRQRQQQRRDAHRRGELGRDPRRPTWRRAWPRPASARGAAARGRRDRAAPRARRRSAPRRRRHRARAASPWPAPRRPAAGRRSVPPPAVPRRSRTSGTTPTTVCQRSVAGSRSPGRRKASRAPSGVTPAKWRRARLLVDDHRRIGRRAVGCDEVAPGDDRQLEHGEVADADLGDADRGLPNRVATLVAGDDQPPLRLCRRAAATPPARRRERQAAPADDRPSAPGTPAGPRGCGTTPAG